MCVCVWCVFVCVCVPNYLFYSYVLVFSTDHLGLVNQLGGCSLKKTGAHSLSSNWLLVVQYLGDGYCKISLIHVGKSSGIVTTEVLLLRFDKCNFSVMSRSHFLIADVLVFHLSLSFCPLFCSWVLVQFTYPCSILHWVICCEKNKIKICESV